MKPDTKKHYDSLLDKIGVTIATARKNAARVINAELVKANWEIGRHIVEYEQGGKERADYGSDLLSSLSKDLKLRHGKGFGRRNILDMRRFYLAYQKWQAVPAKLSWSHLITLLGISEEHAREFYEKSALVNNWSYRELERQIDSSLYERLVLSKEKKNILLKSIQKQADIIPEKIIKDPYILDFLEITQSQKLTEKQLEKRIIDNIEQFLLELGKGFAFIGRQYRISIGSTHFYVDLVFYHRILKCFVLIDLKTKKVAHNDIGQMNLYLNYFKAEENVAGDNEPVGIILSAEKDEILVEYATGGLSNKIFVSKYQLYLPEKKQLQKQLRDIVLKK